MPYFAKRKLLERLAETPTVEMTGLELKRETGVWTSSLYVALSRLEDEGLVSSRWDESRVDPDGLRSRLYRITRDGQRRRSEMSDRSVLRDLSGVLGIRLA